MRSTVGHVSSKEFDEIVANSRLHELKSKQMTCKQMKLDPRVVLTLKTKGVISECGKVVTNNRRYIIWGPGSKYDYYMKRWG